MKAEKSIEQKVENLEKQRSKLCDIVVRANRELTERETMKLYKLNGKLEVLGWVLGKQIGSPC